MCIRVVCALLVFLSRIHAQTLHMLSQTTWQIPCCSRFLMVHKQIKVYGIFTPASCFPSACGFCRVQGTGDQKPSFFEFFNKIYSISDSVAGTEKFIISLSSVEPQVRCYKWWAMTYFLVFSEEARLSQAEYISLIKPT